MMRRLLLIILLAGLAVPAPAQEFAKVGTMGGQFLKIDLDARSVAMGSAGMAFSTDAGAAFRNPAGLVHIAGSSFVASYARRLTDKFSIGGNVRWIYEDLYVSKASGFGVDIGEDRDAKAGANLGQHGQSLFQPGAAERLGGGDRKDDSRPAAQTA